MQSLLILGRQPALGLAELESLYGSKALKPVGPDAVLLDIEPAHVDFARLGGSIKLAKVLNELPTTNWHDIEAYLVKTVPQYIQYVPEGKFRLGLSTFGLRVRTPELNKSGLWLKKLVKATGRSVRVVPNKSPALNSAQVLHNQLTGPTGWELVLYRSGNKTILAQTVAEQDIEAYARRDQNRPKRDAKVGMLPPKLAQILINLTAPSADATVLDPFCGTGVVLQEALLMGYSVYGTDLEPRMIEYSRENLDWLHQTWFQGNTNFGIRLETGDATTHHWKPQAQAVAAETYLGKPLSREPNPELLHTIMSECDRIHRGFLSNISQQLPKGTRLCLAVPAWRYKGSFKHLKTLDYLRELGYTRIDFVHAPTRDLLYYREDQFVARELVVLIKN
jgi:SAM-dependent methyltransferase